ncbi:cytokinin dehydrogenase 3-like isoform X1 [Lycium ferocissimum]|uniref:cytokinin dehydrogenase 3-like isoform X1 n=1 Tax=Lycium ferocissimum TaxID=112874 RepID=UPI00281682A4|nr:cytokinin dehydrogenase 3-like isoform X1 [Lycium ferocissimum]
MAKLYSPCYLIIFFTISHLVMSFIGKLHLKPYDVFSQLDIATRLISSADSAATVATSTDFGKLVQETPAAVLYPSSTDDIVKLVHFSNNGISVPFGIAARGHGHSVRGQAMAPNGVVVVMNSLKNSNNMIGIRVSWDPILGFGYADVGGEQLWVDVLHATLEHGLAPVSWTDYLYLSVGGTLSNAGISGQTFRYGPQISNVLEMDVITGKGEFVTCSEHTNSELFFAVLGGLGQFGIITRARIVLEKAPTRVKWIRVLYADFSKFTSDQEQLISIDGMDYVEGSLTMNQSPPNNWRSSFFSHSNQSKILSLISKYGIIYCLEMVKYYDDQSASTVDEELHKMMKGLNFLSGHIFKKDATFVDFLNRVKKGELKLQSKGLWDVPHPWLNLFVPKSSIMDFNAGVFVDIILKQNKTTGSILVYPTTRIKWDDRMSVVIPEEETFYCVGLLHSCGFNDWESLDGQNEEILNYCEKKGLKIKQYLPHYRTKEAWMNHFGKKWEVFQQRKSQFDPKMILSPGQKIFN